MLFFKAQPQNLFIKLSDIDKMTTNLCNDQNTYGTYNVEGNSTFKRENKPWLDLNCRFARQNYGKLKIRIASIQDCRLPLILFNIIL